MQPTFGFVVVDDFFSGFSLLSFTAPEGPLGC